MRRAPLTLAALTAALLATACERNDGMAANGKICASFRAAPTGTATPAGTAAAPGATVMATPVAADAATPVDDCVRRWAYTLASSRDSADVVADATVAACAAQLSTWNQGAVAAAGQGLSQNPGMAGQTYSGVAGQQDPAMSGQQDPGYGAQGPAVDLVTGQSVNPMAEHANFARSRALLYVVEARAGRCRPPGVVNGQPTGT